MVRVKAVFAALILFLSAATVAWGGSISGRVVNEADGLGIEGVKVGIYNKGWKPLYQRSTDLSGNYTIEGLSTGIYYLRTFNKEGFIDEFYGNIPAPGTTWPPENTRSVHVTKDSRTANIDFHLANGGSIRGRVTRDSDGAAIEDASICIFTRDWNPLGEIVTDPSGNFAINGLPGGIYFVKTSTREGYIDEYFDNVTAESEARPVDVKQGAVVSDIAFVLSLGGAISGKVTSDSDGSILQDVEVKIYDSGRNLVGSDFTDSTGHYCVGKLPAGSYYVGTLSPQDYLDEYYGDAPDGNTAVSVKVKHGKVTPDISISLATGGSISGRVTDGSDGRGLRDVYVVVYDTSWKYVNGAETDLLGRYRVGKLPPGNYYIQTTNAQDYIDEYHDGMTTQANATPINVRAGSAMDGVNFALLHKRILKKNQLESEQEK